MLKQSAVSKSVISFALTLFLFGSVPSSFGAESPVLTDQSSLAPTYGSAQPKNEQSNLRKFNFAVEPFGALLSAGALAGAGSSQGGGGSGNKLSGFMYLGFIPQVGISPSLVASIPVYLTRIEAKSTSSVATLDQNQVGAGLEWYVHGQRFASSFIVSPVVNFMWMTAAPKIDGSTGTSASIRADFLFPTVMVGWRWFAGGFNFGLMGGAAIPVYLGGSANLSGPGGEAFSERDLTSMRDSIRVMPVLPQLSIALGYAF